MLFSCSFSGGVLYHYEKILRGLETILEGHFFSRLIKEGDLLLKIKKSHFDGSFIVFNPDNFKLHTHVRHQRIAVVIKHNVEHHLLPKTNNIRLLESHIRVTCNKEYISIVQEKIDNIRLFGIEGVKEQDKFHGSLPM